jgi:hypothetical protein
MHHYFRVWDGTPFAVAVLPITITPYEAGCHPAAAQEGQGTVLVGVGAVRVGGGRLAHTVGAGC